jgi:KDO2-lipid IV(A) lauroyltransferase
LPALSRKANPPTHLHHIEAVALKIARRLFLTLGIDRASAFSGWCWQTFGPLTPRQRRVDYQLRMIFSGIADAEVRRISRAMWNNLGRVFAESLLLAEIVADRSRFDLSCIDAIAGDIATGQVASIATLHMGNWEVSAAFAQFAGLPLAGVYKRLSNPVVEDWLLERRRRYFSAGLFDAVDRGRAVRGLLTAMKAGASIAMVSDLYDRDGRAIDFMGHTARCIDFPALAARTHKVPLYATRIVRTNGARFRVDVERIAVAETDDRAADVGAATQALNDVFGRWIAELPEQWFWIHPKWEASRAALHQRRTKV